MKVTWVDAKNKIRFEIECDNAKTAFLQIAEINGAGFAEKSCGLCGNSDLLFEVREVPQGKYFELHCSSKKCGGRLSVGQHKNNKTLFISRRTKEGAAMPADGWHVYNPANYQDGGQ